ncbi:MAG TPA: RtcB family protein [Methanoregulaceae archaeon]|nr:RtcB family protein [Methanoregulaceae archaeon]
MSDTMKGVTRAGPFEWELPVGYVPGMRVPGRFFLSEVLAETLEAGALRQLAHVATLPGIRCCSLAMPDIHWGYGFPIGGVGAFDLTEGVISPGGVGFDINCGVRLVSTPLTEADLGAKTAVIEELYQAVPTGVGARSRQRLGREDLRSMLSDGARWAVESGLGTERDLVRCEGSGRMEEADPTQVSAKALQRGLPQSGTLGAGNHFLELQVVDTIFNPEAAAAFGVEAGSVAVMIHCGSRGLGHQVCTDYIQVLEAATKRYRIDLPDRQLACAPIDSPEGRSYFGAMAAAANYAWANRQAITHQVREVLGRRFDLADGEMPLVYDVAHNIAKIEEHELPGGRERVCVHRKGATRAFGPGTPGLPPDLAAQGQPVIIPGSMGTPSFLLQGTAEAMRRTFGSTCHGAGRVMSRSGAKKHLSGGAVKEVLRREGILVRAPNDAAIAEEAPSVYKDSTEVVRVVHEVGFGRLVARLRPIGVIKG